jgi:hypothetical protein
MRPVVVIVRENTGGEVTTVHGLSLSFDPARKLDGGDD